MSNDFTITRGSDILRKPVWFIGLLSMMFVLAFMIAKGGIIAGVGIILVPGVITAVSFIFKTPRVGLIFIYLLNYIVLGLVRYVKGIPLGLSIDGILIMIYLALFFKSFFEKVPWKNAKNDLVVLAGVWFAYAIFQLVNPEAVSRVAWFYAMRGVAFYMLLIIPILFIVFNKQKDLDLFFKMWACLALLGSFKGIMQKHFGVDPWEQAWLDGGGELTHILFGKLRVFSFFSDAGQFGASQGQAGVVFGILALNREKWDKVKIFYGIVAFLGLYGMMISGTRGAIAVPIMGFALYTFLRKNIRVMILGALMGLMVLVFFKYTTIGSSNYTINRMRTAFDPNDASLQVRLENQRRLKTYMASRPFGGGIGSAGNWGQRFTPNTFLANTPTDSWYVMIWAEQGVVGLTLHLFILFYVLGKGSYLIMFKLRDERLKIQMMALAGGMFGIMVASYGNGVLGQMPTGLIMYSSMAFLFLAPKLDQDIADKIALEEKKEMT